MANLGENTLWEWTKYSLWKWYIVLDIPVEIWHLSPGGKNVEAEEEDLDTGI